MPRDASVFITEDDQVVVDWDSPRAAEVIAAHKPDGRYRWPEWKRELHDLLTEAEHRTLTPEESKKVDKHMKTLTRHRLDLESAR